MIELEKISKLAAKAAMAIGNDFNKGFWTDDMDHRAAKHIEKVLIEAIVTTEPVKAEPCGIGGMAKTTCPWCENGFSFEYEPVTTERKCGQGCDCLTQCGDVYAYEAERKGEPVGAVLVNRETREGVMFYSADMIPDPATIKDRFVLVDVYTSPQVPEDVIAILDECRTALMECDRDCDYELIERIDAIEAQHHITQVSEDVQRKVNAWNYLHGTTKLQMDGGDREAWVMFHRLEHIHKACPQNVEIDAARKGEKS